MKGLNFKSKVIAGEVSSIYKALLLSLLVTCFSAGIFAQEPAAGRIPNNLVPYKLPNVDSIKGVLNRVRHYYEATCSQTIIDSKTGKQITDFSTPNTNAKPSNGFLSEYSYTHGVVLSAFDYITKVTGDTSFFSDNTRFFNYFVNNLPYLQKSLGKAAEKRLGPRGRILHFEALDDYGSMGNALIKTYLETKNKNYLPLINRTADYISNKQFRLPDGTVARHLPQYESVWSDDMYMGVPFLVNMGVLTKDIKYFEDALKQVLQMAKRLYVPEKGLFAHGWDVNASNYGPRFYWSRANGWALMYMAEVMDALPENYKGRAQILHIYRSQIRSLAELQDSTDFWHNLVDKNDTYLETSCTAMFTYAIAKGINEGWIRHVYGPVALMGWNTANTRVLANGAVDGTCEGTTYAGDNTYYYYRGKSVYATHGYGPVLYAGAEMIRLLKNDKFEIQKTKSGSINSAFHFILKSEWPKK